MLEGLKYERYSRQVLLPEIGDAGQQKLLAAKVLVIGAGGLGCPVLQYLTAAGVGKICIVDGDVVSLSNLQRQVLYTTADIGKRKAIVAASRLRLLNEDVNIEVRPDRITNTNAFDIISNYDLVIDGSDNFSTRYLVNDATVLLNKPLVYGSIFRFEGQVAVFNRNGSANYRDVFAQPPLSGEVANCAEAGVLGVLPGIIGSLMANEAIKLIIGIGTPLVNKLLTYNSLYNSFYEIVLEKDAKGSSLIPKDRAAFEGADYEVNCSITDGITEIGAIEFDKWIEKNSAVIIDVREQGEQPAINEFKHSNIPLSQLRQERVMLTDDAIVLFCQSGKRSKEAAEIIKANNPQVNKIYSLKDGILQWKNQQRKYDNER